MKRTEKPAPPREKRTASKVTVEPGPAPVTVSHCNFEIKQDVLAPDTVRLAQTIADALAKLVAILPKPNPTAITIGAKE